MMTTTCRCCSAMDIRGRCHPNRVGKINQASWKSCPMKVDTALWLLENEYEFAVSVDECLAELNKRHIEKKSKAVPCRLSPEGDIVVLHLFGMELDEKCLNFPAGDAPPYPHIFAKERLHIYSLVCAWGNKWKLSPDECWELIRHYIASVRKQEETKQTMYVPAMCYFCKTTDASLIGKKRWVDKDGRIQTCSSELCSKKKT